MHNKAIKFVPYDSKGLWSEEERGAFCAWLAAHPEAGEVIPGSGGCRKVRWRRQGAGKNRRGKDNLLYSLGEWRIVVIGDLRKKYSR